jgi:hypothetical protein
MAQATRMPGIGSQISGADAAYRLRAKRCKLAEPRKRLRYNRSHFPLALGAAKGA